MVVVSLFNGMSTGRQALENIGVKVEKYYSSEIKPYAIKLTQHHFPDTIRLGDITKWREWDIDWKNVDLILSGSPCQDLSSVGNFIQKKLGINGNKSKLFFVFCEILNHCKSFNPNVLFLQENVASASKMDVGIISRELGVYPVRINSSLLTAQMRDRLYWTNIKTRETIFDVVTDIPAPLDLNINFSDIITDGFVDRKKSTCLLEGYYSKSPFKSFDKMKKRNDMGLLPIVYISERNVRLLNKTEMCRLQGFPDNYCDAVTASQAASLLGDGWTLPIIEHIFKFIKK